MVLLLSHFGTVLSHLLVHLRFSCFIWLPPRRHISSMRMKRQGFTTVLTVPRVREGGKVA